MVWNEIKKARALLKDIGVVGIDFAMVWNEMTLEELEKLGCSWRRFCHGVEHNFVSTDPEAWV